MPIIKKQLKDALSYVLKYKKVIEDFLYMYFVVIIQRILGFAVTFFLVRALSQSQFAEYTLIIGYLSLLAPFSFPGIGNALMQSTARGYNSLYPLALKLTFLGTVFAGLILLILAYVHSIEGDYSVTLKASLFFAA
ncbi:MAG: hypothetical protein CMH31_01455, partial [Micavibrio sp.]|nr:hypothetical protein [Micavibrio sp.]